MPCYDSRSDDPHDMLGRGRAEGERERELLRNRLNKATRLLCALCRRLEEPGSYERSLLQEIPGLRDWYDQHKITDQLHKLTIKTIKKLNGPVRRTKGGSG